MGVRSEIEAQLAGYVTRALARTARGRRLARRLVRKSPRAGFVTAKYHGMRLQLDLRDNVQHEMFYMGGYERPLLSLILDELKPTDTFVDIGAHIGAFSLPAAGRVGSGHVYAFEPAPDTADVLERNASRSRRCSLTVVRTALGSETGVGWLRQPPSWLPQDLSVRSLHGDGPAVVQVPIMRFDDWASEAQLDQLSIVKIDVEGNELNVLRGMLRSLCNYRPRLIVLEIVPAHLERAGTSPIEVADLLVGEAGYQPFGPSIQDIAARPTGPFWPNAVLRPSR